MQAWMMMLEDAGKKSSDVYQLLKGYIDAAERGVKLSIPELREALKEAKTIAFKKPHAA